MLLQNRRAKQLFSHAPDSRAFTLFIQSLNIQSVTFEASKFKVSQLIRLKEKIYKVGEESVTRSCSKPTSKAMQDGLHNR